MGQTRIVRFLLPFLSKMYNRFFSFQKHFSIEIFSLFFGFLFGNLFGTFLQTIRQFFGWDGFIVFGVLLFIEILSYIIYHRDDRSFLFLWKFPLFFKKLLFWRSLNAFKLGLMLGFFIDAFKVGS